MQGWFNICSSLNVIQHINKSKDKNHIIIFNRCSKSLEHNSTSFHDKSSDETRNRKNVHQHNKIYIELPIQHHTKWGTTETISSKVRNKTRMSILSFLVQHSLGIPNYSNKTGRKKIKGIQIGKEEVKLPYLGINLTKEGKDLGNENYNTEERN
jgi:hypothetical protein